ncbi:MAG: alpha-amylase family glycosyl hydrolase [bacterium]|nr:alpha-amylase family glycosyl hydrolase [bacterium]
MWWKNAVIYELYVDKFAGNFTGLTGKLDYLKNLGINCVHILPHYPSPMVDDGYDVSDYKGVRAELGTIEDFKNFATTAHKEGIKIIVDLVLNHASASHPWFLEAHRNKNAGTRELFLWSAGGKEFPLAINVFSQVKPKNWIFNKDTGDYYFSTFYPDQADFNWQNPEVLSRFLDIMDFWVSMGADGFRLDAAPYLIKKEGTDCKGLPEVHEILMKLRSHIDKNYPEVVLLAEVHDTLYKMKEYFDDGVECHLTYNFYLNERMMLAFKREDSSIVDEAVKECFGIPENTAWANFLRNHDEISMAGLSAEESKEIISKFDPEEKYRFEAYTAMRLASMFKGDREKIINAFQWLFDTPGAHIIYYGDEIGMENEAVGKGEDMRRTVRGNFDWTKAEIEMNNPSSLFNAVKKIIAQNKK